MVSGVRLGRSCTAELATALGKATTTSLEAARPQVLIVRDTRESGPMLEAALAAGVAAAGGDALLGGVLPTPAAAILVRRLGLDLAAVVSASHNPFQDNGIKFFDGQGTKLGDELEARIESLVGDATRDGVAPGNVRELNGGFEDYLRELEAAFPLDLSRPPRRPRLRQRRHPPGRAGDLRTARRQGRDDRRRARRPQHQRRLSAPPTWSCWRAGSSSPAPSSASPSTATATACSRSTAAAASTTATS